MARGSERPEVQMRPEEPRDHAAVATIVEAAFGQPAEAELVRALRGGSGIRISMVAAEEGRVIAHVFFSPVTIDGRSTPRCLGLAPLAVAPDRQRSGAGGALMRAGFEACREAGAVAVFVLGHPSYYPRFGFAPAFPRGLRYSPAAIEEAFMVLELEPGALEGVTGEVAYGPEFDSL